MRTVHWISAALLAVSTPAQAQISADQFHEILRGAVSDPDFLDSVIDNYDVAPRLAPLFRTHLTTLYGDDVLLRGLAEELAKNTRVFASLPDDEVVEVARDFGAAWFQDKAVEGVKRLPPEQQRAFLNIAADVLSGMPDHRCAANMRGTATATQSARDEIEVLATMSEDAVARYLTVLRQSVTAEITDVPVYEPLTVAEREVAEAAFGAQFLENLEAHPDGDGIMEASDMGSDRRNDLICELGITSVRSAVQVQGQTGELVLRYVLE